MRDGRNESCDGTCQDGRNDRERGKAEDPQSAPPVGEESGDKEGAQRYPKSVPLDGEEDEEELRALTRDQVDQKGLELACEYLEHRGFDIVETKWRCDEGTVDIVGRSKGQTVLVSCSTKLALESSYAIPELSVDYRNYWHYRRLALLYLADHRVKEVRYDLIAMTIIGPRHARLRHLVSLYSWEDDPDQGGFYRSRDEDDGCAD